MNDLEGLTEIEALARMAAQMAGHDPDRRVKICLGGVTAFDDLAWRYPDFVRRAEVAYAALSK